MNEEISSAALVSGVHILVQVALIVRVLLRPHREAASRIAWIVVILAVPGLGILAYLLLGETSIGRKRAARLEMVVSQLPDIKQLEGADAVDIGDGIPERYLHLFEAGKTVNGFDPVRGNRATLMENSNTGIDSIVADIDDAKDHVHVLFYIWLTDNNGLKVAEALKRAVTRGVACRALADDLGSRAMIHSKVWKEMKSAGVQLGRALQIGNPLLRPLKGRIDLRNHRKIVVIDNLITYCGSQNCADPEFRVKPKFAPWVDALMRFEGPIVRQNQLLFAGDWEAETGENINHILMEPFGEVTQGFPAQVIGTGPTARNSAMPEIFETLIYAARRKLIISTPYYVPVEAMQAALCASARRGVDTTIIFPARNDSWIVGAASRSYYEDLLAAGVHVYEYVGGLLHTKSLTIDGEVTLIGSANMDRRSFELNYENNILFCDVSLTATMIQRQESYIAKSRRISSEMVAGWTWRQRLWNNTIAMIGPVL
jgi:cardiolipin synthase